MIAVSYTILDILYLFGKSVKKNTHRGAIFHRARTIKTKHDTLLFVFIWFENRFHKDFGVKIRCSLFAADNFSDIPS